MPRTGNDVQADDEDGGYDGHRLQSGYGGTSRRIEEFIIIVSANKNAPSMSAVIQLGFYLAIKERKNNAFYLSLVWVFKIQSTMNELNLQLLISKMTNKMVSSTKPFIGIHSSFVTYRPRQNYCLIHS